MITFQTKPYLILNRTWGDVNTVILAGDVSITTQNTLDVSHFTARDNNAPAYYYVKGY